MSISEDSLNFTELIANSPEETKMIACRLFKTLKRNDVLALYGELGAGKTCFVQGLAEAMGIKRPISSPTFIIINRYDGIMPLFHVDLYRINSITEISYIGLEECFEGNGITAIEWAEKAEEILPEDVIQIHFSFLPEENKRSIKVSKKF